MAELSSPRDLTQEGATGANDGTDRSARKKIEESPFNPVQERENIRGRIAMRLVGTLMAVIAVVLLIGAITAGFCAYNGKCAVEAVELRAARSLVELVLTPLVGLVGAVTGFYFGEKSGSADSGSAGDNR